MEKFKHIGLVSIIMLILVYLVSVYCLVEPNPMNWKVEDRAIHILLTIMGTIIYFAFLYIFSEMNPNKKKQREKTTQKHSSPNK